MKDENLAKVLIGVRAFMEELKSMEGVTLGGDRGKSEHAAQAADRERQGSDRKYCPSCGFLQP